MIKKLSIMTHGQGLVEVTSTVQEVLSESLIEEGLLTVFIRHTSASLLIQENADPSAKYDLEQWLERLVPDNDPLYTHIYEGADDMPAHIKAMLTRTSISIPFSDTTLLLGTWQGLYLWEHRVAPHTRTLIIHVQGD